MTTEKFHDPRNIPFLTHCLRRAGYGLPVIREADWAEPSLRHEPPSFQVWATCGLSGPQLLATHTDWRECYRRAFRFLGLAAPEFVPALQSREALDLNRSEEREINQAPRYPLPEERTS